MFKNCFKGVHALFCCRNFLITTTSLTLAWCPCLGPGISTASSTGLFQSDLFLRALRGIPARFCWPDPSPVPRLENAERSWSSAGFLGGSDASFLRNRGIPQRGILWIHTSFPRLTKGRGRSHTSKWCQWMKLIIAMAKNLGRVYQKLDFFCPSLKIVSAML